MGAVTSSGSHLGHGSTYFLAVPCWAAMLVGRALGLSRITGTLSKHVRVWRVTQNAEL
jgi:hypothetical protein